jgi:histidinol-phosphate aminotransferase
MADESAALLKLAVPGVRNLFPYQPGKPISELAREYGIAAAVKLASNENPLGPSPKAQEAARLALMDAGRYPDSNGFELKAALAKKHDVAIEAITLGNGSNEVLELVARAFLGPDLEAVFSDYAFIVYPIVTQSVGARARVAPARPREHPMAYGHDLEAMAPLINARTRVVFIANPNNPTGTYLTGASLESFIADLPSGVLVVVDEAYFEYVAEPDYPDTTQWLARFPNLIVTRTFSKAYGLAGLRIGYALSHPQIADLLNRVREPFNVNTIAQAAALAALEDTAHLKQSIWINREGMRCLQDACAELGLTALRSVGNFLCVDIKRPSGAVYEALLREGVIVRPIANYGLPNHLRITIGLPEENERLINALRNVLT